MPLTIFYWDKRNLIKDESYIYIDQHIFGVNIWDNLRL